MSKNNLISITGGNGHLGCCLIQMLLQKDYIVNALYYHSKPKINHPNVNWIQGDISKPDSLNELFRNSSVMIHCASLISIGEKNESEVYNVNVHGTEIIIDACLKRKTRMIYISSSTAVKETKEQEVFDENRPYKTENDFFYAWTKALSEKKILAAVKNNNLDAFIIRPTAIVGPPDYKPSYFGRTILDLANNKMPVIVNGGYNLLDVRDLSRTIINSIIKGKQGEVYLVGGTYFRLKQIAKLINPKHRIISFSLDLMIFILPFIKLFPMRWHITKESLITLKFAPKHINFSKAINNLDHKVRPITETINDLLIWFRKEEKK